MYTYGEFLNKAKASNEYSMEEWFKIFQILFNLKDNVQFYADWEYDIGSVFKLNEN